MIKAACPACGAEIQFQSPLSIFVVCGYCHSTIVRHDAGLESLGKMADLQADVSPLQIGTNGRLGKNSFNLIGRIQLAWDDGNWNEWFVRLDDGRDAWLGEAQGFYMLSFPVQETQQIKTTVPVLESLRPGQVMTIAKVDYVVSDIKRVKCSFAQGELPFIARVGDVSASVDLNEGERNFASITYEPDGSAHVFVGRYIDFADFHFQNLRTFDGW